jgi:hypothetical protein
MAQLNVAAAPLTEEQGDAMLEELRQIRQVLEKMQQQAVQPAQARRAVQVPGPKPPPVTARHSVQTIHP